MKAEKLLELIDGRIRELRVKLDALVEGRAIVAELVNAPSAPRAGRRKPIAPGSVEDRILEVLGKHDDGAKLAAIVAGAGVRPNDAKKHLRALIDGGYVQLVRAAKNSRYVKVAA